MKLEVSNSQPHVGHPSLVVGVILSSCNVRSGLGKPHQVYVLTPQNTPLSPKAHF